MLSFGGTKAGLMGGEAVVYLNSSLAERAIYVRKQVNQLPSKSLCESQNSDFINQDLLSLGVQVNALG